MLLSADSRQSPGSLSLSALNCKEAPYLPLEMTRCAFVVNVRMSRLRPAGRDARFS